MEINEKYKIVIIDNKRYYRFDMTTKLPDLENTTPYFFKYKDIEIKESSWNKMAVRIVEELAKRYPHENEWYLSLSYYWSKTKIFSEKKETNFTKFRNIYLNTNHSSSHSMMSIQALLNAFEIKLSEVYFLIRRHHSVEPKEVREYYKTKTIKEFSDALRFRKISLENITKIINNFNYINLLLSKVSDGFDDFFLFDDYYYFCNYKQKVYDFAANKFFYNPKKIDVIYTMLNYLDNFYKNRSFYERINNFEISPLLKQTLIKELNYLFENLKVTTIRNSKLFARMSIIHEKIMKKLKTFNNPEDLYKIAEIFLSNRYYFKYPMIAIDKNSYMTNDEIILNFINSCDKFTIEDINNFVNKCQLKKPYNYLLLMNNLSNNFIQISMDTMVKKDKLSICEGAIDNIRNILTFYINSFDKINTIDYRGYESLPYIGLKRNKFLLVGIVRTYLSNNFSVSFTGNNYQNVEFEITLSK